MVFAVAVGITDMALAVSLDYYDKILAAIAASLTGGALIGSMTVLRLSVGLLVGAVVATGFVYHALFLNPPRPTPSRRAKAAAIVWHGFVGFLLVSTVH
jgi:hypothetical protein